MFRPAVVGGFSGPAGLGGFRRLLAVSPRPLMAGGGGSFFTSTALLGSLNCPFGSLLAGFRPEPFGVNWRVLAAVTGAGMANVLVVVGVADAALVLLTEAELTGLLLFLIVDLGAFTSVAGCFRLSFGLGTVDCLMGSFLTSVWDITLGFMFSLETFLLGVVVFFFLSK